MWLCLSKLCALLGLDPPHCFFLIASSKAFCSWSPRYPYSMNSSTSSSFKRSSIWACKFSLHACAIFNYEFVVNNCASYNKENPYNLENFEFLANMCKLWQKEQLIFACFFLLPSCTPLQNMHLPKLWKTNGFSSCVLFKNQVEIPMWNLHLPKRFAMYKPSSKSQQNKIRSPKKSKKPSCCFVVPCVGQLWPCTVSSSAIVAKSHCNLALPPLNTKY